MSYEITCKATGEFFIIIHIEGDHALIASTSEEGSICRICIDELIENYTFMQMLR